MTRITTVEQLEALYGTPAGPSLDKVTAKLTPLYWRWISRSRFCILSTIGPEGTDGSPRGDDGPVVSSPDPQTLLMPDWRGNNRLDSLRNIVRDDRVSLMFMVPGSDTVIRVNGRAQLRTDDALREPFRRGDAVPRCVIEITVTEVYSQCARALKRAGLWSRDDSDGLPTPGAFVKEQKADFDAEAYDAEWPGRAARTMW